VETFVVRIWTPADPATDAGVRGTVEHVRTSTSHTFGDGDELLAILTASRAEVAGHDR
jgi:hypothetical protein